VPQQVYDLVIVGGSLGGVAAALRAGALGVSVCLLEATDWLGGQYSAQGVTKPDENQYIETVGSTASYRAFRQAVRTYYRNNYTLSAAAAAQPSLNPGGEYPGFSGEPLAIHQVLLQLLQAEANVQLRLNSRVTAAQTSGDVVQSLTAVAGDGTATTLSAKYFLDATDLGDLLPTAGVEYNLGAEGKDSWQEPEAPDSARPDWIQPITMVVALERRPDGENHLIEKPAEYDKLKAEQKYTIIDGYITKMFVPGVDLWSYRRYLSASNFNDAAFPCDLSMLNMGANDYQAATIPSGSPDQDAAIIARARQASLGYVYWLQTEVPRDDGNGSGYPSLKVRPDQFNTPDGTSAQPYIRESRRIKAVYTIVQQDLDKNFNPGPRAKNYPDSCGIGFYGGLDIHGLAGVGMPQRFIDIQPFELPLRALIPVRVKNLLPACKNIGVSHIANGAYRLHPMEWNVGEVAGALAAFAMKNNQTPSVVAGDPSLVRSFQHELLAAGVPLFWWSDITFDNRDLFSAVHLLGVAGVISGYDDMSYRPNEPLTVPDRQAIEETTGKALDWPSGDIDRGQAALWLVGQLGL